MSECTHRHIVGWNDAATGEAQTLWSCAECRLRFVPIIEAEALRAENERLRNLEKQVRALYNDADEWDCDGLGLHAPFAAWHPVFDALEAIDAAMKASGPPD